MGKKKTEESVETAETVPVTKNNPDPKKSITYVVVRDGLRVSDKEYEDPKDTSAIEEKVFWETVANNHSHGEPVEIVQYDAKKHRVW